MIHMKSLDQLRRYVSNDLENYDMSCYSVNFDTLVDAATNDLHEFLIACGFKWGEYIPELSSEQWRDLTREFEI